MQLAAARIMHWLVVRDFFIVGLTDIRLTQIAHAVRSAVGNDHILVRVSFLFAAVMQCLFFGVFRALAAAFRAINDIIVRTTLLFFMPGKLLWIAFGQNPHGAQCILENRQEAVNPIIGTLLTQVKEFTE